MASNSYNESSLTTNNNSSNNNTTFVEANPSNFRAIVQHLTGSHTPASSDGGGGGDHHQTTSYKLHERRQQQQGHAIRKLDMIKLNNNNNNNNSNDHYYYHNHHGPTNGLIRARGGSSNSNDMAMASPVSTLDGLGLGVGSPSPRTTRHTTRSSMSEEERVVIAEKGFYLHPVNHLNNGATRDCKPQLLPLFPLHSPRDDQD
ncbi:VQ motif-containing protein 11 [Bienertia sinuspersici]